MNWDPGNVVASWVPMTAFSRSTRLIAGLCICALTAAFAAVTSLPAQSVRGIVTDRETGQPVPGVFVTLRSAATDTRIDGTLSTEGGHYALSAPGPGSYRIRVERIGYESWTSEPFELAANATISRPLEIGVQAVALEGLQVAVTGGCHSDPAEASAVGRLWREIQKALEPAAWAEREGRYRYRIVRYHRTMVPRTGRVVDSRVLPEEEVEGRPFRSLPVEQLMEDGFRQSVDDTTYYYAPDAEVLVSDAFGADHCFELASESEAPAPGWIGLSFRPTGWWGSVDVRGTFWLSTDPVRLRELRFWYEGLSADLPQDQFGGRISYRRLPDGGWIVDDWSVRMPRTTTRHIGMGPLSRWFRGDRTRTALTATTESGGRVVRVVGPEGQAKYAEGSATVTGTVTDSLQGKPLAGARVAVAGSEHWASTDSTGAFELSGVPAGTHRITVSVPELELAGLEPPSTTLIVRERGHYVVELATPSPRTVRDRACPSAAEGSVVVVGRVTDQTGVPVPEARVTATWTRESIMVRAEGKASVSRTPSKREVTSGPEGIYRICGLPAGAGLTLKVVSRMESGEDQLEGQTSMELPAEGLVRRDLTVLSGSGGGT